MQLLVRIDRLVDEIGPAEMERLRLGPTWIAEAAGIALANAIEFRSGIASGRVQVGPHFSLVPMLGEDFVRLYDSISDVASIDEQIRSFRLF